MIKNIHLNRDIVGKFINNYFITLFSLIPISIILGSTVSLINILLIDISFLFLIFYIREFSFLKNKAVKYLFLLYFLQYVMRFGVQL